MKKVNQISIKIARGKISDLEADVYVLPYYPQHVSPDCERNDAEYAGARGVRKFVDFRLLRIRNQEPLRMGEAFITDSLGGKSRLLANVVCRASKENIDEMKSAIRSGLIDILMLSEKHSIRTAVVTPLCASDGVDVKDFCEILVETIKEFQSPHSIEEITIITKHDERYDVLKDFFE
ncbi:MAG: hypothetical protein IKL33_01475 [Alphaproteobacteria bacterium]|nr:hypothetical protein [Alphaproteobacteria bacterium]